MSEAQKLRFQRSEELKKLEGARSLQVIDFQKRATMMQAAFLKKYGSFLELARMGMKAPKRKPSKLELRVAKVLGKEWEYVGDGKLTMGGLVPASFTEIGRRSWKSWDATITRVLSTTLTRLWG